MITVHLDIREVKDGFEFRPHVSGIPTENEQLVASQVLVILGREISVRAQEQSPKEPPKPKPRRRRK